VIIYRIDKTPLSEHPVQPLSPREPYFPGFLQGVPKNLKTINSKAIIIYLGTISQGLLSIYYCFIGKQAEAMASIRDVLAKNLRENRRRLGISQEKLAERADLSTQFVAMIEQCRKFPSSETLEQMAAALGIEAHELFAVPPSPEGALERLHQAVLIDIKRVVGEAVEQAIAEKCKETKGKA
jgi:transcriptional regulator with XRE-family HTH domain